MTANEVMDIVLKDLSFYQDTGGGITLSGGEPTAQPQFCEALLINARNAGIHTTIETSGMCGSDEWRRIASSVDLILFDIKASPDDYQLLTGATVKPIIDNLRKAVALGARVRIRMPVIPGVNDKAGHRQLIDKLLIEMPAIEGLDTINYNPLGESKWSRFYSD